MHARLAERIAECDRLEAGQEAEGQGLRAAIRFETCCFPYSTDPYLQQRFEQGYRDGRDILASDRAAVPASSARAGGDGVGSSGSCDGSARRI